MTAERPDMPDRWTDPFLDSMRGVGDPAADDVIASLFGADKVEDCDRLLRDLIANDQVPPERLPPEVRDFLDQTDSLPDWADSAKIAAGQALFERYAPMAVMMLFCRSLPMAYLGHRGVQVLHLTARLSGDARRRVVETAQLIVDVMTPGGLEPGARGIRSAQKVRLMHAALRHLILSRGSWRGAELGVPINQEDLGATLLSFSSIVISGLERLGADFTEYEAEAYLHTWKVVGHLLGVAPEMTIQDMEDATALLRAIERRQFRPSPEGRALTAALIDLLRNATPGSLFDDLPVGMLRFMVGDRWANDLGVPRKRWTLLVIHPFRWLVKLVDKLTDVSPFLQRRARRFGGAVLQGLMYMERGDKPTPFRLPTRLQQTFLIPSGPRPQPGRTPWLRLADLLRGFAVGWRERAQRWGSAIKRPWGSIMRFRLLTRHFALGVPYRWLPFATRFRDDDDVVGAAFFEEFAKRTEARFDGRGTDTGLMDDFDALASERFDPSRVDPIIRDFYENTTRFDLELEVHWSLWFYPVGWLYKFLVSRRMRQFDIPQGVVEHLQSWIELIDIDKDGDVDVRAWVRIHGDRKHPMWVGAYKIYTTEAFGTRESYVSVAFPLPGGNLTTVLSPGNLDGGGFSLRSDDRESEEAGMYHIFPRSTRFAMVPGYGMHEVFEIRPTKGNSEIEVVHTAKWFFLTCFTMNYQIRPKRQRAKDTLATFVDALRDPKPPPSGGLRARWRRSRRTGDAPR